MGPATFYHLLEDSLLEKFFSPVCLPEVHHLKCRDWDGKIITVPVTPLGPAYQPWRIDNPARADLQKFFMGEFKRAGILIDGIIGEARVWLVPAQDFYNRLAWLAERGITIYAEAEQIAQPAR